MTEQYVSVETYADESDAAESLEELESTGFHPALRKEMDENSDTGCVYVIEVPFSEADRAAQVLEEYAQEQDQELDYPS